MIHFYMIRFYINTACAVRHLIIFTAPFKGAARIFGDLALNALSWSTLVINVMVNVSFSMTTFS